VFFNGVNNKIEKWKLKNAFNQALKQAGIEHVRFVQHTLATKRC